MNDKRLETNDQPVKFLVTGHIYGRPGQDNFHPAMTLISNLALLREQDLDLFFFLGDTVWQSTDENFDDLETLLLDRVDVPIFNAVGNHDVLKREIYTERYGNTVYAFEYKNHIFIVLDTTLQYYDLIADEIVFVERVLERAEQSGNIKHIHILMHHVLFLEDDEIIGKQVIKPNEGDGFSETFHQLLADVIYPASELIPISIYAGDVGAFESGNLAPFYKRSESYNVQFFATGLGNNDTDSVLVVEETPTGEIFVTPFSLTGKAMHSIETYDFEYWLKK
jgi:hypothetical protein